MRIPYNIFVGNGNTNDCQILMQQINTQPIILIILWQSLDMIQKKYGM